MSFGVTLPFNYFTIKQSVEKHRPQNLNAVLVRTILLDILRDDALMESLSPDDLKKLEERVTALLEGRAKILNLVDMI